MLAGLVIVPLVSFLTKAPDKKKADELFSCYDRKVTVRASTAIEDATEG
jgi:SSS family solute:Na+ symporter